MKGQVIPSPNINLARVASYFTLGVFSYVLMAYILWLYLVLYRLPILEVLTKSPGTPLFLGCNEEEGYVYRSYA